MLWFGLRRRRNQTQVARCLLFSSLSMRRHYGLKKIARGGGLVLGFLDGAFGLTLLVMVIMRLAMVMLMVLLMSVMKEESHIGGDWFFARGLTGGDNVGCVGLEFPFDEILDQFRGLIRLDRSR